MFQPGVDYYPLPTVKDDETSTEFRNEGNDFFRNRLFFGALENYNKSLMFAPLSSVDMSLAFANRSAVYIEVKEYEKCLENIKLARDHGYPQEKTQTLIDREMRCKKFMETQKPNPEDDPWNFFKLSYPANEKIPFIANCLELSHDKQYGRGIITNRGNLKKCFPLMKEEKGYKIFTFLKDLNTGDIIAIEEPLFKTVQNTSRHLRCTGCMKSNKMSLIPHSISCSGL